MEVQFFIYQLMVPVNIFLPDFSATESGNRALHSIRGILLVFTFLGPLLLTTTKKIK